MAEELVDWRVERIMHRLSHDELVEQLEFEYYAILAANPNWETSLEEFLQERGIKEVSISLLPNPRSFVVQ